MTNDFKKTLLDYITNLTPGEPTSAEIFKQVEDVDRNGWIDFMPQLWVNFRLEGLIKSKTSDKVIFYGGYVNGNGTYINDSRGIIIITDSYLNPIQTIYEYSSGTLLRPIQKMIQEEDGQFIAIDSTIMYSPTSDQQTRQAYMTNEKRVIMLNDISNKTNENFEVNLRQSYILGNDYKNFICRDIFKNPNSSHYCFIGFRIVYDGTYDPDGVRIISLKINVGSANEWWVLDSTNTYVYGGGYAYFDSDDNINWKILLTRNKRSENKIQTWTGKNTGNINLVTIQDESYQIYIDSANFYNQVAFVNENKAYYVQNNQRWGISGTTEPKYIGLYEVDLATNTTKEIYLKSLGNYDFSNLDAMFLQIVNGELYIQYCDNVSNNTANYSVQRYVGKWNPILIKESAGFISSHRMFYVSQTFNLLKLNIIPINLREPTWYMGQVTEVYNITNYNGEPYENYNSLIGDYGNIYSNDKIMFSRDLYNISVTNNYTVSSLEVPNTFLNDITLDLKELVGKTNTTLVQNTSPITTNVYEMLFLNYINTINVKDNEDIIQLDSAKYINSNINIGTETNYNNTKCTKVEIKYQDNTNKIFPIAWTTIDDTHKYAKFTLYVDKPIYRLELISNDQSTTYITIERELEVGKYYTFKQYLKVE